VVLIRPVGTDTHISGVVALRISVTAAAADVARRWLLIVLGALTAAVGFVLLATVLARWVLRPLAQLERGVLAVTAGRGGTHVPGLGGPPELRALAVSFNRMSDAVVAAADKERQLVADASHQLRNPMAALRLRVDSLAPDVAPAALAGYHSLATEVERLEALLDGLLALASADEVAAHPELGHDTWCWPDVVVRARLAAWRPAARDAGVRLVDELPPDHDAIGPVGCTDSELAQILDVLLDNAIRYAGRGAAVRVRADRQPGAVRLVVEDSGPGLPDADRARATQRFWRAAKDGNGPGTGLGLAIAERLVTARAGSLRLLPGEPTGLAVHVTLPHAEATEPPETAEPAAGDPAASDR
jgi:signal transduction histidine kinase